METLVHESIMLTIPFLRNEDDGVSETVLPLIAAFLYKLRHQTGPEQSFPFLQQLLEAVALKMQFVEHFNFDVEGDDEMLFQKFRDELEKLFRGVVRHAPQLAFQFLKGPLTLMLSQDCTLIPMAKLESFLRLFYVMGEGLRVSDSSEYTEYFQGMMGLLMNSSMLIPSSHVTPSHSFTQISQATLMRQLLLSPLRFWFAMPPLFLVNKMLLSRTFSWLS